MTQTTSARGSTTKRKDVHKKTEDAFLKSFITMISEEDGIETLEFIKETKNEGLPLDLIIIPGLNLNQMKVLKEGVKANVDTFVWADPKFSSDQMEQIFFAQKAGLSLENILKDNFNASQMIEILIGQEEGVFVDSYAKINYNYLQMREIRLGLKSKIKVIYDDTKLNHLTMKAIRLGTEKGLDMSGFCSEKFREPIMKLVIEGVEKGVDVTLMANPLLNYAQARELLLGLLSKVNIKIYNKKEYDAEQMFELRNALIKGGEAEAKRISHFKNSAGKMRLLRKYPNENPKTPYQKLRKIEIDEKENGVKLTKEINVWTIFLLCVFLGDILYNLLG